MMPNSPNGTPEVAGTGHKCLITVLGIPDAKPLQGEYLDAFRAVVTEEDPIWRGATLTREQAKIQALDDRRRKAR